MRHSWLLAVLLAVLLVAAPIVGHDRWPDSNGPLGVNVLNVKEFGARGDGTTDDGTAIQSALDAANPTASCSDDRGQVVFMPHGVYITNATINVPKCVALVGEHRNASVIKAGASFPAAALLTLCEEDTSGGHGCRVERLGLDGSDLAVYGILSEHSQEFSGAIDTHVIGWLTYGIWMRNNGGTVTANYDLERLYILQSAGVTDATDRGIYITGDRPHTISNITIDGGGAAAAVCIELDAGNGYAISSIQCEFNGNAVFVNGQNAITINGVKHVANGTNYTVRLGSGGGNVVTAIDSQSNASLAVQDDRITRNFDFGILGYYIQGQGDVNTSGFLVSSARSATPTVPVNKIVQPTFSGGATLYSATTAIETCAAAFLGTIYYDTNAGALGTADDGRLCVCDDNAVNGYRWRAVGDIAAGVPVDLAGNSTTDCGT